MSRTGVRTRVAIVLQAAAVLVLVDRSHSMPAADTERAADAVVEAARAQGAAIQRIDFAGRAGQASTTAPTAAATLDPAATDIEAALQAALAAHARARFDRAVIVSDGFATAGDTERGLRALRDAGLPLQWIPLGRPPTATRIAEVLAPERVVAGQRARITVRLAGQIGRPLRVDATARSIDGDTQATSRETDGRDSVAIDFDARGNDALVVDVALRDPASGQTMDALADAAVIAVAPPAAILYVQGSTVTRAPLARSLASGGWKLDVVPAASLDGLARSEERRVG